VLDVVRQPAESRRGAARRRAEHYPWTRTAHELLRIHRVPDALLKDGWRPPGAHQEA
jgi:hypothetical protein